MIRRLLTKLSVGIVFGAALLSPAVAIAATASKTTTSTTAKTPAASTTKTSTTSPTTSDSGAVQGYASDTALQIGTIVQLASGSASKVAPATLTKIDQMYGATVDPHTLSVTVSSANVTNEAYVATSGTYNVLVTTQNGPVKAGDYVTVSSIDGVGMKATPDQLIVFGRAAAGFDGKSNAIGSASLKDTTGKVTQKVSIGIIPVVINIQHNPNQKSTEAKVPKALQRLGEQIAEKPVGPLRIYLSIGITGISIVAAIVLLYSGIRNSIISIGRNPLSKKSIFRALIEIILTSVIILIIGLFAVYLLLKL